MKGRIRILSIIILAAVVVFFSGWGLMYPSTADPKNLKYVLWKAGLYRMDLDTAAETMIGDADRNRLVIGKTEGKLRSTFGYLLPPIAASPYLRNCYENSSWKGKKVFFIRHSNWMVVFEGDRATDLVLIKGC